MALSEDQRKGRMKGLGSSEMSAVMGLCPYRTPYDIWLVKTGRSDEFEGNDATERGNFLEPALMAYAEKTLGHPLKRNITVHHEGGILAANLDGFCEELNANIEGKSISGDIDPEMWGEEWTDQIPDSVLIQTHTAMVCGKLSISYVPVILPDFKRFVLKMFEVKLNPELGAAIVEQGEHFWREYVLKDVPPPDCQPSIEVLKRIRRVPNTIASVSDYLVNQWQEKNAVKIQAEKDAKEAQAAVLAAMAPIDADGAVTESGRKLTYLEVPEARIEAYDRKAYRVLRLAGAKKAKSRKETVPT